VKTANLLYKLSGVAICVGILPMPHWYYELLRIGISATMVFLLCTDWRNLNVVGKLILVIVLALFNPVVPFHFAKALWALFDVVSAIFILIAGEDVQKSSK